MDKGKCLFYEGITQCDNCCNDCLLECSRRCESNKTSCGGYIGLNCYWGSWEEVSLIQMREKGYSWQKTACLIGRSVASCKQKWKRASENTYLS